jgi:CHAT domain-containing protein
LGDEGTLAFIITRDSFTTVELPQATPASLRTVLADRHQWPNRENPHPLPLRTLYAWLVTPLADHLHTPRVGLIPHQLLHYVPLAALTDGRTYLGEQHTLFTLPSASSLPFIQDNARVATGTEALILGSPEAPSLPSLIHAAGEAEAIAALLGAPVYLGVKASEARLRTSVEGAAVVHLAAHGSFNAIAPALAMRQSTARATRSVISMRPSAHDERRAQGGWPIVRTGAMLPRRGVHRQAHAMNSRPDRS